MTTLAILFVVVMLYSYFKKHIDAFEFNRETIEMNTNNLLSSITQLNNKLNVLKSKTVKKTHIRIGDAKEEFTNDEKMGLYKLLTSTIASYEKCNYVINMSQASLPFPYTEITMHGFMILATAFTIMYVTGKMNPIGKLRQIKELQKIKNESLFTSDTQLQEKLDVMMKCSNMEIDSIAFTLKVVFYSFVIMFLIFYINTIVQSTGEFKNGLYNSGYFEEQRCYNG